MKLGVWVHKLKIHHKILFFVQNLFLELVAGCSFWYIFSQYFVTFFMVAQVVTIKQNADPAEPLRDWGT